MKRIQTRLGSLCMAVVMLLSLAVTPAMAVDTKDPPTEVTNCEASGFSTTILALGFSDTNTNWLNAITGAVVENTPYTKGKIDSFSSTGIWESGTYSFNGGAQGASPALKFALNSGTTFPVTIVLSAEGYKDLTVKVTQVDKWSNTYTAEAVVNSDSGNGGSGSTEKPDTSENGTVAVSNVTIAKDNLNSNWVVSFANADGYVSQIQTVKVNDTEWPSTPYGPYSGGSYKKNIAENTLAFAQHDNLANPAIYALKSGDVITITATGYNDLTFKFVLDDNGNASAEAVGGSGSEPEPPTPPEKSTINVSEVKFESNSAGDDWYVTFGTESDNYINAINGVSVNGNTWKSKTGMPYTGGYYCKYNRNSMNNTKTLVLGFAQKNTSAPEQTF